MKTPLIATIQVPLEEMLPQKEFIELMAYSEREGLSPDAVMLKALLAFLPQISPPPGSPPAMAA